MDRPSIGLWTGRLLSNGPVQAGPPMRHPFQTETFDPSDPEILQRVQAGERLTWLYLGATVYRMDSQRWVVVDGYDYRPQGPCSLAYPLPASCGANDISAVKSFEDTLRLEFSTMGAPDPMPAQEPLPPPAPATRSPITQPQRSPKGRSMTLATAVPLPSLQPWTEYGRLG